MYIYLYNSLEQNLNSLHVSAKKKKLDKKSLLNFLTVKKEEGRVLFIYNSQVAPTAPHQNQMLNLL